MDEKKFAITIHRSKWLLMYLITIHIILSVTVVNLLENDWLSALVVMMLLISFIYYCQRYHWWNKSYRAITKVERDIKHRWKVTYSNNTVQEKLVLKHCVATSKLVILNFLGTRSWNGKSVTILADAVDAELFRQLRVYLMNPKSFLQ